MGRRIYAAVAPPAADCSALASENDGASFVRSAQRPLRSPPGTASCLTMAAASALFCALVIPARPPVQAAVTRKADPSTTGSVSITATARGVFFGTMNMNYELC